MTDNEAIREAATSPSPESAATPDGVRLAELCTSLPLSRASVFEVVRALQITTSKGPGPDGRGRVAWVTSSEAAAITTAAHAVHRGELRIADLNRPLRQTRATVPLRSTLTTSPSEAGGEADPGPFLRRLEAAELAIRSGLGLTTAEAAWILGSRPTGPTVTRGGIQATRTGWNCWRLQRLSAKSPD